MKKKNSPFVRSDDREVFPGTPTGEDCYIDREVYLEFVQTGLDENGKAIGSIEPVVHETKTSIDDVIGAYKDKVGLRNILMRYARTGDDSLFAQRQTLPSGDYSAVPNKSPEEIYASLPKELTQGLSLAEFMKTFTPEMLKNFLDSLENKEEVGDSNE